MCWACALQCVLYPPRENQYITVLRKNRIFAVPVYPPNSTTPYGTAEITKYGRTEGTVAYGSIRLTRAEPPRWWHAPVQDAGSRGRAGW